MLYDDYLAFTKTYQAQYGDKTIVLMEVGSFFELYAVENEKVKEGAPMSEVCALLNIQSTRKNKSIQECSRHNPMMAGFPSATLKKFTDMLIQDQYTVVLVEQTTPPPNPKRAVTQILSPSTYMDETMSTDACYLMVWLLSKGHEKFKSGYLLTVVSCDISTGETSVTDSIFGDETMLLQEGTRIMKAMLPKEIVLISEKEVEVETCQTFIQMMKHSSCCIHDRTTRTLSTFQSISYQNTLLRKVFPHMGMMSPIEYLDMERHPLLSLAFVYLLQFVYEHNDTMISHLRKPVWMSTLQQLRVTHTSLEQLNIIPKHNESSILKLLNTCDTAMGKRRFHKVLTCPTTSISQMNQRYDLVERLLDQQCYKQVRPMLSSIKDMERLFRRIVLLQLQPSELCSFLTSLDHIQRVSSWCLDHKLELWKEEDHVALIDWIQMEKGKWNLEEMNVQWSQLETNIYQHGIHSNIDKVALSIEQGHQRFRDAVKEANQYMGQEYLKLETTAERTYVLTMTSKRWETLLSSNRSFTCQPYSSTNKTIVRVFFKDMDTLQQQIHTQTAELRALVKEQYLIDIASYVSYAPFMERLVTFIATLDVGVTSAKHADTFRYTRPIVVEDRSFIRARSVRHPLIERVQTDLPYIANDVDIGGGKNGILLHGINASGKSSYMKSIGVNIIMAQAGMFVAAESWEFAPYLDVFTRIPGGDNLFKGHSTFVAEMVEVRAILTQSSAHSLIIGDELASGTESVSAISIVAAGIVTLAKKEASFLFATHLHEVAKLDVIQSLSNVKVCHMSVHYDESSKVLIYDRLLKEGSGEMLYGLEVCKSLDMPTEFLYLANTIRQSYLGMSADLVPTKTSNYSASVFMDQCSVCGKKAVETHHIQEQATADEKGFIGAFHKHTPHNLMKVCEGCHDQIHHKEIKVDGYKMTSNGVSLQVTQLPKDQHKPTDESKKEDIKETVRSLRKQGHSYGSVALMTGLTVYRVKQLEK